jgi:hypothetical protein
VKNRVVFGKGNTNEVRMDSDADLAVVICLILTVNSAEDDDKKETVTIDLGNLGPEGRPFDRLWQPR